jgi:hypothetical protein
MGKLDPGSSTLGQTKDAQPAFNGAFADAQNTAALPQKLYMDALMSKINLARAGNPLDMDLINRLSGKANEKVDQFMNARQPGGGPPGQPGQIPPNGMTMPQQPQGPVPMIADGPPAPIRNKAGKVTGMQPPPTVMAQPPPQPAAQAPGGGGDPDSQFIDMMRARAQMPQAPAQPAAPMHVPLMLGDPNFAQNFASTLDASKIPSTATEDTAKSILSSQAMMNRYLPTSLAKEETNAASIQAKHEDVATQTQGKEDVANINHAPKAVAVKDTSLKDQADISKIVNENYGQYQKNPWMLNDPHSVGALVGQIDGESDPRVKQAAMNRFSTVYNRYKQNHPDPGQQNQQPAAPPASPGGRAPKSGSSAWTGQVTPQQAQGAESAVNDTDSMLQNHWAQPFGVQSNGMIKYIVPKDKLDAVLNILKSKNASSAQIQRITDKYRAGPSTIPGV